MNFQNFKTRFFFACIAGLMMVSGINYSWAQAGQQGKNLPDSGLISPAVLLLSEYIRIPSETGNEKMAADFLMNQCINKGLIIKQISDSAGRYNFAASLYPMQYGKPNIIFLNHMDVVPAGNPANWTYPPYEGKIDQGKVWGRGATDNKGLAIVQLCAIEKFVFKAQSLDFPYNVTLLCVSGEETGGANGSAIVSKNFDEVFTPAVVIGEGGSGMEGLSFSPEGKTFFGISIAQKGFLWLNISCSLQSHGHASVSGNNYANKHLVEGLSRLVKTHQPIVFTNESKLMFKSIGNKVGGFRGFAINHINWKIFRPYLKKMISTSPELESILCNTITVSNLGNFNSIPNQNAQNASATIDCRLLPGTSSQEMIEFITRKMNDSLLKISIIEDRTKTTSTQPEWFFTMLANAIQQTYADSEVVPILFPALNDNIYFRNDRCPVYGLNPMIMSPSQIQSIHNYNEFIDVEDIDKGIEVFEKFLGSVLFNPNLTPANKKSQQ